MSPVKEPSFFASEVRAANLSREFQRHAARQTGELKQWLISEWSDYLRLFDAAKDEIAIGEATPSYLWSASAADNIHARLPGAKIVMILRDPAERAYSHYLALVAEGLVRSSFADHIDRCERTGERCIGPWYPFLEVGLYYEQVRRYLDLFAREQIRIYWYEEAWSSPKQFLADLFRFLGVDPAFEPDFSVRSLERRTPRFAAARYLLKQADLLQPLSRAVPGRLRAAVFRSSPPPPMAACDRQRLVDYYAPDIRRLASLLGRDLDHWLRATV